MEAAPLIEYLCVKTLTMSNVFRRHVRWCRSLTSCLLPFPCKDKQCLKAAACAVVTPLVDTVPVGNWIQPDIDYNERFTWEGATDMSTNYRNALKRGLPFPILTVAEYFSLGREGFSWGGQYRAAGYFASIMLWASLASWLLMNLLLIAVPRYGAYMKALTGVLLIGTNVGYYCLLPKRPLTIYLEGGRLEFHLGWCYWLLMVAGNYCRYAVDKEDTFKICLTVMSFQGILCFIAGILISIIDLVWPHTFSTVLEVYYGTPYDRHVILEESSDVRYRKRNSRNLEDPTGLGSRILRRLSSKTKDTTASSQRASTSHAANASVSATTPGVENKAFQNDVPKSPWRYPFRRVQQLQSHPRHMQRTLSQESGSSIASASIQISPLHKHALARMLPHPPVEYNTRGATDRW
ncbi:hypothetical protein GQX74_001487 [Glossina fuscipes]|nr:hypothetical protein GQX74_001487 [Glossina fuscipes]